METDLWPLPLLVTSVWGGDRVGVRLGPSGTFGTMSDSDPNALFGHAVAELNRFSLAYLHLIEPRIDGSQMRADGLPPVAAHQLRKVFRGPIIAAGRAINRPGVATTLVFISPI